MTFTYITLQPGVQQGDHQELRHSHQEEQRDRIRGLRRGRPPLGAPGGQRHGGILLQLLPGRAASAAAALRRLLLDGDLGSGQDREER